MHTDLGEPPLPLREAKKAKHDAAEGDTSEAEKKDNVGPTEGEMGEIENKDSSLSSKGLKARLSLVGLGV